MFAVLGEFAAEYDVLGSGAKYLRQRNHVKLVGRVNQRISSLLWSVEALWLDDSSNRLRSILFRDRLLRMNEDQSR